MKTTRTIRLFFAAAALLAAACGYKESFPYSGDDRINFTADSPYFSFGAEPFSVTDTTLIVGVEIVGSPREYDREYRIALDAEHTTARQGDHYDALRELYTLPANASSAGVPVHVHRLNLDDETVYAVRLQLAETGDFRLGVAENRAAKVCFTNRLDCPGWWNELSKWLGEYNVRKYQKFIELYGRPITDKDIAENRYGILRVFRQVKAYFDENPEYGVLFPDVAWPV